MVKFKLHLQHPQSGFTWISVPMEHTSEQMEKLERVLQRDSSSFGIETETDGVAYFAPHLFKKLVKTIIKIEEDDK